MIELKQCCKVPFPEKLFEQYEVSKNAIYANVNASKVVDMMKRFINEHKNEPMFLILEIPTSKDNEENGKPLHKDVYYLDGLDEETALSILKSIGNFLVKDGLNTFGFGGHESHEEMLFGKYNVMTVYTADAQKYEPFFEGFGIEKTQKLLTAWNTFNKDHFGESYRYESHGKTIYDLCEDFKKCGLYFAERRED